MINFNISLANGYYRKELILHLPAAFPWNLHPARLNNLWQQLTILLFLPLVGYGWPKWLKRYPNGF